MRPLRILFMGTPDFAVAILDRLIQNNHTVVGVVTAPDKPAGRGRKLHESSVKKYAKSQNIPLLQPSNLKDVDFQQELKALNANLHIVVAFRMLPKSVWNMPTHGTFNLHASLLPAYRGAAPIHWALINGEKTTGVTTFFIDDKIDTGAMILQKEIAIAPDEIVGTLHDKLMYLGASVVEDTLRLLEKGPVQTTVQPIAAEKTAYKLYPHNCKIDWTQPLETIYNKIRGLNPFPAAWCTIHNGDEELTAKIYGVSKEEMAHEYPFGTILADKKNLKVAVQKGYLCIHELKLAGKKKMDTQSLLNGFQFHENAKMS